MVSMMNAMVYNGDLTFPTNKNGIFFRPKTRGQLRYITLKELDKEGYRTPVGFQDWLLVATSVAGNAQQKQMPNLAKSE